MKLNFNANQYKSYLDSINKTISKIMYKSKKDKGLMFLRKDYYLLGRGLTDDAFYYDDNGIRKVKKDVLETLPKKSLIFYGTSRDSLKEKIKLHSKYKPEDFICYEVEYLTLRLFLMHNTAELFEYRYKNNLNYNERKIDGDDYMASEIKDIFEYFATGKITLTKKDTTYWIRCYHKDNNVDWYYDNSLSYLDIPEFLNKFDFK